MKFAVAAYPLNWHARWEDYAEKIGRWVGEAGDADLIAFPEYAAIEAAMVGAPDPRPGTDAWLERSGEAVPAMLALLAELAARHDVHILSGSGPCPTAGGHVNAAHFIRPSGATTRHDKQCLTPWERTNTALVAGAPLQPIGTDWGRIGVTICYDGEFPALARALRPDLLLVPSCTEALSGASRVRLGARARALENQCIAAVAPLVGPAEGNALVDHNRGRAGVYGPPDHGFSETGILREAAQDTPGWVFHEIDADALRDARRAAAVTVPAHWDEAEARARLVADVADEARM